METEDGWRDKEGKSTSTLSSGSSACLSVSFYLDDEQNEEVCVGYSEELLK